MYQFFTQLQILLYFFVQHYFILEKEILFQKFELLESCQNSKFLGLLRKKFEHLLGNII